MQRSPPREPSPGAWPGVGIRPGPPAGVAPAAELHFLPRAAGRRLLAFPCSPSGQVEIDLLSAQARIDYLFARALRGRDYASPIVVQVGA